jgi:hypothetical protein
MMAEDNKPITFGQKEIDPSEVADYKRRIDEARGRGGVNAMKGSDPVGVVPRPSIPAARGSSDDDLASSITDGGGVAPRPRGSPLLSPQTAQQIQEMAELQAKAAAEPKPEEPKKEESAKEEDPFDLFDLSGRNEAERVLNNKKRRKEIESRCAEMDIEDLIMKEEVRQRVPIVPGKFEVIFRSITPEENLFVKKYVTKSDTGQSDQYILEKFSLCQLTCAVVSINDKPLIMGDHLNQNGDIDEVVFEKKLRILMRKSGYVIADLGLNYSWFDVRVRKLLNPDTLGNG